MNNARNTSTTECYATNVAGPAFIVGSCHNSARLGKSKRDGFRVIMIKSVGGTSLNLDLRIGATFASSDHDQGKMFLLSFHTQARRIRI